MFYVTVFICSLIKNNLGSFDNQVNIIPGLLWKKTFWKTERFLIDNPTIIIVASFFPSLTTVL